MKALMKAVIARPDPIPALYVKTLVKNGYHEETSIRQIFMKARQTAPCLLLFEDVDSLVTNQVRSYFLNEVDGIEDNHGILMIGSTNNCRFSRMPYVHSGRKGADDSSGQARSWLVETTWPLRSQIPIRQSFKGRPRAVLRVLEVRPASLVLPD